MSGEENNYPAVASLQETLQKVNTTLHPAIDIHVNSEDFSAKDGLDFLDVKNTLLLSYMIDLVRHIKEKQSVGEVNQKTLNRLTEMKTVLDKMKSLDKKLRYQIDKLLATNTTATSFASGGDNSGPEDPLQFRPDPKSLVEDGDSSDDDSEAGNHGKPSAANSDESDPDDDLQAAISTYAKSKKNKGRKGGDTGEDDVYRAPRQTAVPYTHDIEGKEKEREKRARRNLRATELAQTLRAQYGDAPEQEDIHGGSDYGKQVAAARRLAQREAEKTKMEEEGMIRLTTSRKDKKEKKRLMRMEGSNLAAIANLGNLVRETEAFGREENDSDDGALPIAEPEKKSRYDNGKRRRDQGFGDNQEHKGKSRKPGKAKNSLQAALYSTDGGTKKKKKSRR